MSKLEQRQEDRSLDVQEMLSTVPDSLKYRTDNGRTVIGGGGILPDVIVQADSLSPMMQVILGKNLEGPFIRDWIDQQGPEFRQEWSDDRDAFVDRFVLSDTDIGRFVEFAASDGVTFVSGDTRTKSIEDEESFEFTTADLDADRELLRSRLKGRIAWRLYDRSAWYPVSRSFDKVLSEALTLWEQAASLAFVESSSVGEGRQ